MLQRHFRLTCRRTVDVRKAASWSNNLIVTTETTRSEFILPQPEMGSDAHKPLRCANCGGLMQVTIRSEAATSKRRILMWSLSGIAISLELGSWVMLFLTDQLVWFIAAVILAVVCIVPLYFSTPSQLRATIYDKDGHFMLPEENGHSLDEIDPQDVG
jgi:hypothetical protein